MSEKTTIPAGDWIKALVEVSEGKPYSGPVIEWQAGTLAVTTPEPHIALSAEYIQDNDIEVDLAYLLERAFQAGFENGWRKRNDETHEARHHSRGDWDLFDAMLRL